MAWPRHRKRRARVSLLLFALATVVYLPGIGWGLPHATAPERIHAWGSDELGPLGPVAELYSVFVSSETKFDPRYPLFHYWSQALLVAPYLAWLKLVGGLGATSVAYPYGLADPITTLAVMTLLSRAVSLFMAGGVVVAAHHTASLLWNRTSGLVSAMLVLAMYPMFYYSRTSNVDMGALFWTSLGLAVLAASLRQGLSVQRAAWLGLFAALATATKDASYAVFLPVGLYLAPRHLCDQRRLGASWAKALRAPLVGLVVALAIYAVASGIVFHPQRYLTHVHFITHGSPDSRTNGFSYFSTPASLSGYLQLAGQTCAYVADALGTPTALLAVAGLAVCRVRIPNRLAFALPVLGIALGVIAPVRFVKFRFVFIMAYVLALFAGYALATALRSRHKLCRKFAKPAFVLVCGWSLLRGADLTYQMICDSRYELAGWLRKQAEPGDRIGYYGDPAKLPALDADLVTVPFPELNQNADQARETFPEFIVVIPQQHFEPVHEWNLPADTYRALDDGSLGYRRALALQTGSLFSRRPLTFVNPPVQVFVDDRRDPLAD